MVEISRRPPDLAIAPPRRTTAAGTDRCYVRFAVLGDRATWRANGRGPAEWPQLLAAAISAAHDLSWCDARSARATTFDVRRVQVRVAVAHRPHLVAVAAGMVDAREREWDAAQVRAHLVHCADVLSRRGALLLTTTLDAQRPGPLTSCRPGRLRARIEQLNGLYDELHQRFGTIHLDPAGGGAAGLVSRFADELTRRGLELPAAPGGHH